MCLLDVNQLDVINNLIFQRELEDDRLLEQFHQHSWPCHLLGCHRLVIFSIPKQESKCHKLHQGFPLHSDYEIFSPGIAISISGEEGRPLLVFFQSVSHVMMKVPQTDHGFSMQGFRIYSSNKQSYACSMLC